MNANITRLPRRIPTCASTSAQGARRTPALASQNFGEASDNDCDGLTTSDLPITDQTRRPTPTQWPTPDLPTGAASREFLRPRNGLVAICALEPRISWTYDQPGEEDGIEYGG